ncbi:MAG TPA: Dabb family protein [Acidimicrobiia bacterium]|nr:Dabb family protein [Acidimicrobiia bacterium]
MIRHVVMFNFRDGTTGDQKEAVRTALRALPEAIPEIRAYRFGADLGLRDDNFDFVVTADFDDVDGFVVYRDHPDHQKAVAEHIAPIVTARAAVQFEWPAGLPADLPG